jgi:hypothetical protein
VDGIRQKGTGRMLKYKCKIVILSVSPLATA